MKAVALACASAMLAAACASDSPAAPSSTALVTFTVHGELFRVSLTTAEQVAAAHAAQNNGPARIPIGYIVSGTDANTGWSWHVEGVTFAEVAIERCDGRPSNVEREGVLFGGGTFCPWSAAIVRIE